MIRALRLAALLARLGWVLAAGMVRIRRFPALTPEMRAAEVRAWSLRVLRACGVALEVDGAIAEGSCLLAINHVSWLDIMALNAAEPTRFVAKSDVDRWPVLGGLARDAGTLFIERERPRDAMRVMHDMARCLRDGERVSVFPEGTTSDGSTILPLHANLFQAAVSAAAPVQPVLLRYLDASDRPNTAPAYIGDDTLLGTLRRIAATRGLRVRVSYLPVRHGDERRALAAEVQDALTEALGAA